MRSDEGRDHLVGGMVGHLSNAQVRIGLRECAPFYKDDSECGTRVAEGVKVSIAEVERLAAMTDEERAAATSG